ncbi:uncharacterized protein CTRU02_211327 [Colletotrichum truncatum]|uniref:Uncharacterized protein n=1 Tax=Colletotrichum truncatum TaxID=5467 RepID=A0ACC3YRH9_COLTU|nr:uncharacterized protein CTRU02_02104 [Colletotrichum truncatum]KAF6799233.1 hypothetical protein CTRU02_02104 [Colletotrichum truncatum]
MTSGSLSGEPDAMAGNGTARAGVFLASLTDIHVPPVLYASFAGLFTLFMIVNRFASPKIEDGEPPTLKPTIPFIGHLLGMLRNPTHYMKILQKKNMPIATLPILNGKLYTVWDPLLVQAVFKNKNLSMEPFSLEFSQRELGFGNDFLKLLQTTTMVHDTFEAMHQAMTSTNVRRMNANALGYISGALDEIRIDKPLEVSNSYLWVRNLMTLATTQALYGPDNPFRKDDSLLQEIWTFDEGLAWLMFGVATTVTARRCYQARTRLQAVLNKYYEHNKHLHADAAQITKNRAAALRKHGIPENKTGDIEIVLLHVAVTNTIPALFWFMTQVFTHPELVSLLREEVGPIAQRANNNVTIDISELDETCPLLVSCYRESMRLCNKGLSHRRVLEDTTISDGNGRSYLLKKGCNVEMSQEVCHSLERAWGPDWGTFMPDRFVESKPNKLHDEAEKLRKAAFVPFGGGKHLCPGRNFAFAETMGLMVSLVLGFNVTLLDKEMRPTTEPVKMDRCTLISSIVRPVGNGEGLGVKIERREGWEEVKWHYTS